MLATLRQLARALGCRDDQAEDVVRSEASARASLSRRGLFQAAGAVAAGVVFADASVDPNKGAFLRLAHDEIDRAHSTLTSFDALMKRWYTKDFVESVQYDHQRWAHIPRIAATPPASCAESASGSGP